MHILLTDLLRCPRCGPEFGLILLGDRIEDRRVLEGRLGCPNCREKYPVVEGFLDIRPSPRSPLEPEPAPEPALEPKQELEADESAGEDPLDHDEVVRIGALLGVREGPGYLVLTGDAVRAAPALAEMLDGIEVVALDPRARRWSESPGVSRMTAGDRLPFAARRMRGVYLGRPSSGDPGERLAGGIASVGPGSRLVVEGATSDIRSSLEAGGLDVILDDEGVVVAQRVGRSA